MLQPLCKLCCIFNWIWPEILCKFNCEYRILAEFSPYLYLSFSFAPLMALSSLSYCSFSRIKVALVATLPAHFFVEVGWFRVHCMFSSRLRVAHSHKKSRNYCLAVYIQGNYFNRKPRLWSWSRMISTKMIVGWNLWPQAKAIPQNVNRWILQALLQRSWRSLASPRYVLTAFRKNYSQNLLKIGLLHSCSKSIAHYRANISIQEMCMQRQ